MAEYLIIGILVVGLVLTNAAWLFFFHNHLERENLKEADFLNRINVLANKPALPTSERQKAKPGWKAPQERKPRRIEDKLFDPEMEAVGKLDPSFIDRARGVKK